LSLALCLAPLLLCACEQLMPEATTVPAEPTSAPYTLPEQTITLGYAAQDSLNPFFSATTLNTSLVDLVYEKLYKLDGTFTPVPVIASFANNAGTELKVNIRSDLYFSDNSNITAYDVVYSFNQARLSALYRDKLANITFASASGAYEVSFTLQKADAYVQNLLDFPIVKNNTANNIETPPTGSGLYTYEQDGGPRLVHNMRSALPRPGIGTIELVPVEDTSSLSYDLETGKIDAYYTDLNTTRLSRMYASFAQVPTGSFVYIGVNQSRYALSIQKVRQALSLCLGRAEVCGTAYQGNADPAYTIFNPRWSVFTASKMNEEPYKQEYAAGSALLDELGYTSRNTAGVRTGAMGTLRFTLLINAENEYKQEAAKMIAETLLEAGIQIEVTALPWDQYLQALTEGSYELYLGEVKIPANMDFSALFSEGGNAAYGIDPQSTAAAYFNEYANGSITPEAFNEKLQTELPLIPVCYRSGLVITGKSITGNTAALPGSLYENIHQWVTQ
jgi:peptide/nickel transport system substrate-binding protein